MNNLRALNGLIFILLLRKELWKVFLPINFRFFIFIFTYCYYCFFIFVTKNPSKITSMQYNSKLIKRWWNMECMEFWICFRQIFSWNWKKNIYWLSSIYKNSWIYGKILRFALKKVSRFLFRPNIKIKDFFFSNEVLKFVFVILAAMHWNYLPTYQTCQSVSFPVLS